MKQQLSDQGMADLSHRSHLKDNRGSRVVDGSGRALREDVPTRARRDLRYRKKVNTVIRPPSEQPHFKIDIIGQPPKSAVLGTAVHITAILSLCVSEKDRVLDVTGIDTSRLVAAVSLITTTRTGETVPLEAGVMTGQQLFDSVRGFPESCAEHFAYKHSRFLNLGYFNFSGLLVRQAGVYSIRITLIDIGALEGSASILAVDSEPVKIERHNMGVQRRRERI